MSCQEARATLECRLGAHRRNAITVFDLSTLGRSALRPRLLPAAMIEIVPAAPQEYDAALTLLFNQLPPSEQKAAIADVLTALRRGRIANHGVLTAKSDGRMVSSGNTGARPSTRVS